MSESATPSRRSVLIGGAALGALLASGEVFKARPAVAASAAATTTPVSNPITIWYDSAGSTSSMMATALPVGNGRMGALFTGMVTGDSYYITDQSLWTGGANTTPGTNGFPYDSNFGSMQMLATAVLNIPAHTSVSNYRRQLDLSNGYASVSYTYGGVTYTRDVFCSHADDVIVIHLSQSGNGSYTGTLALSGWHSESPTSNAGNASAQFSGSLSNGLAYGAFVRAAGTGGTVSASGSSVSFSNCTDVVLVLSGGTNYSPTASGFKDTSIVPLTVATNQVNRAIGLGASTLLSNHLADFQPLQQAMTVNLGTSTSSQRAMTTDSRLSAAHTSGSDPELHAAYIQFGRYLMISGSRSNLPINLQGPWADSNTEQWDYDYHTDINVQMNYWLTDRAGLSGCFDPFANYIVNQQPSWATGTINHFNDSSNSGYKNSNGKIAGWTTAISTNVWGGMGWDWHPAGNAWLCNQLFDHYQYTQNATYLGTIYPVLKSACQFWEARLITDSTTGKLVDDNDWSPEHGPGNSKGITYAQELVWQLFENYRTAAATLGRDSTYATTIQGLQGNLYLPQVSSTTGWLEEWMSPDNLGETEHRHLSPLVGLFPGDRITADQSPAALITGVTNLLKDRGMTSYGWGVAWRAACWARLKNAANAYTCFTNGLNPSVSGSSGTAGNFLDIYSGDTMQIDANFGLPSAAIEMLVYSRPGRVELLPAVPSAWSTSGSVTGVGVRGGFTVDFSWSSGRPTTYTLRNVGSASATTTVVFGSSYSQSVTVAAGSSVTNTVPAGTTLPGAGTYYLVNRASGKGVDDPGWSTSGGTRMIQWTRNSGSNQQWVFTASGTAFTVKNNYSGLFIDAFGGQTTDGTAIIQWSANNAANQTWKIQDAGNGYVNIVGVPSGKAIGVVGNSTSDNAQLELQTISSSNQSQQWQFVAV